MPGYQPCNSTNIGSNLNRMDHARSANQGFINNMQDAESRIRDQDFAQGVMNVGEAMAVPIIRQLKQRHLPPDGVAILDAQPGTSCPVVESMRGADFVLLVTEPTPFGLHDLRLAVEVARGELGLPVGVVVNRDGIGDSGVDDYCAAEDVPILMRIPFDRRIAEAISDGSDSLTQSS